MTGDSEREKGGFDRRTALKSAGLAGIGLLGGSVFTGPGAAKRNGPGKGGKEGGPCFKDFECEEGTYAKYEFACVETECVETECLEWDDEEEECLEEECLEEECVEWAFVHVGGEDVLDIEVTEVKGEDESEPIEVSIDGDGYIATEVLAFGGDDCGGVVDENGVDSYHADPDEHDDDEDGLVNRGGQTAAISNLQFCLEEDEEVLPECPLYGTSRTGTEDGTVQIWSIRYDSDANEVVEQEVGDIPDDSTDQNYPNGLAFDPDNEIWYFAEEGGILKTMNEDGNLGIKVYEGISGGANIAAAAFYDGGYYYTPQGGDTLWRAELDGNDVIVDNDVCDLPRSNLTFGDIAIDRDADPAIAYFSVSGAFFEVNLDTCDSDVIVESNDRQNFAVLSQIAFAEGTLWAHNAGNGEWRTVDVSDGSLSDLVDTTREYTDLAQCGFFELDD